MVILLKCPHCKESFEKIALISFLEHFENLTPRFGIENNIKNNSVIAVCPLCDTFLQVITGTMR